MHTSSQYLDDEHMQLYKWSGAGTGCVVPQQSRRTHSWHASSAVLALMTALLLLNGCDKMDSAEQADTPVDQTVQDMQEPAAPQDAPQNENGATGDGTTPADPAQGETGEKTEPMGEELQKQ